MFKLFDCIMKLFEHKNTETKNIKYNTFDDTYPEGNRYIKNNQL